MSVIGFSSMKSRSKPITTPSPGAEEAPRTSAGEYDDSYERRTYYHATSSDKLTIRRVLEGGLQQRS